MSVIVKKEDDVIIYEINQDANTMEVEMARKGLERKNQLLGFIRDGEDLFTCTYLVQTMYEFNINDNNYTIANSYDKTKLRTFASPFFYLHHYITK